MKTLKYLKSLLFRIKYWMILMDIIILSSPYWSIPILGVQNSVYFLGFSSTWLFLNVYKGRVNKQRYVLDEPGEII